MPSTLSQRSLHYMILSAVCGLLYFTHLGGAALWDLDEGRNASASHAMMVSENYVVPTFNGNLRNHKPVLQYWLHVASYHLFGVNEFAARLPSALAALLSVIVCYELARAQFGKNTGFLSALVLAGTPMIIGAARFANPDALLNVTLAFTMWAFWQGQAKVTGFWYAMVGFGIGLALLAKGPVGIVLPGGIIFCYLLWERRLGLLWDRRVNLTSLMAFLVAAPWYIWVTVETKARFISGFVMVHNVDRFINPMENHAGTPLYYVVVLLIGMAPWSLFILMAFWLAIWSAVRQPWPRFQKAWAWAHDDRARGDDSAYRLLLVWAVLYVVFFSVAATKLPMYVLSAVTPLSILIGRMLERWRLGLLEMPRWYMPQVFVVLLLGGLLTGAALALGSGMFIEVPFLRGRQYPETLPWAAFSMLLPVAAVVGWQFYRRGQRTAFIASFAFLFTVFLMPLGGWANAALNPYKAPKNVAEILGNLHPDEEYQLVGWYVEHLPSLNFYLKRDITHIHSDEEMNEYLTYPMPVYFLLRENVWQEFQKHYPGRGRELGRCPDLYKGRTVVVVTNQP